MANRVLKLFIISVISFSFLFAMSNIAYAASDTVGSSVLTDAMVKQYFEERTLNERISFMNDIRENRPEPYGFKIDQATGMRYKVCDNIKLLPSKGESNILVVPVAFADYSAENEESISEIDSAFFGAKTDDSNPYESVASYYYRSSFGQMELKGTVLDWYTADQNRDYYDTATKREELLSNIISYYDEQINYSDYDTRDDGYIDGIYLYIAGEGEGWGSPFSSFTAGTDSSLAESNNEGLKVGQYAWLDSIETRTIIYQTGLMLGLEEYYSYAIDEVDYDSNDGNSVYVQQVKLTSWYPQKIMHSDDMMNNMNEDHNAYSKMLLGWIEPVVITSNVTDQELSSLQTESLGSKPKCLLVPANGDVAESSFFIVEYDTKEGNNILSGTSGTGDSKVQAVRVFKVDANKHNTSGRTRQTCLISRIDSLNYPLSRTSLKYCSLTPTSPLYKSTYMYDENGYFRSSGVSVIYNDRTIDGTGNGAVAKINVTIESDLSSDYKYNLEKGTKIYLKVYNGLDLRKVAGKNVKIYDENGNAVNTMSFGYSKDVVDNDMPYNAVFKATNSLEPGKYTIEVPEGILFDTIGHFNEAKTIELSIEEEQTEVINEGSAECLQWYSNPLYLTNGKSIIVRWNTNTRYMDTIDADGNFTEKVTELPGEGGGIVSLYELTDGNLLYIWNQKYAAVFNEDGEVINSVTFNRLIHERVLVKDGEIIINDGQYDETGEFYYKRIVFDNSLNEIGSSSIKKSQNEEFFNYYNSIRANDDDKLFNMDKGCLEVLNLDCKVIRTIDATEYATEIIDVLKESNRKYLLLCKKGNKYGILQLDGHFNIVRYNELSTAYTLKGIEKVKNGYALECSIIDGTSIDGIEYMATLIEGADDNGDNIVFSSGWSHSTIGYIIINNDYNTIKSFTNEYGYALSSDESGVNTLIDPTGKKTYTINYNITETDTCTNCNHNYGEWLTESDATCTEPGVSYRVCSICGIDEDKPVDALGHSLKEHKENNATCTENGNSAYYSCERCDKYFSDAEGIEEIEENSWITEALGHGYVEHEAKEATCTDKGHKAYQTCSRCDYTTYEEIEALGHNYVEHEAKEATCTDKGHKAYQTCSRCDYTTYEEINALGHDYVEHEAKAATCTDKGHKAYQTCSRCDYTTYEEIKALGHDYVEHEAKEATCTEKGHKAYQTCSRCDYTTYEEIPATGHSFTKYTSNSDATCTADGTETSICDNGCGEMDTRTDEGTALGHDFGEWTEIQSSGCVDKGSEQRVCKRCQLTETRDVQASGHTWDDDYTIDQEATCIEDGSKSIHCQKCEAVKDSQVIPALGHTLKTNIVKATTATDGIISKTCQVCNNEVSKAVIPKASLMNLSYTTYTYNGAVKNPIVTVKDEKGKKLLKDTEYTVKYASGRKYVGTYKVTISLKGNYSGSKTLSFKIIPKGTYISSLSRATKAFTVKWKKQSTQTAGYQIVYSTSSKFISGNKYVTITNNKTTAKKITKLKAKKKYYVKIRTYKTVNGTRYYSGWSSVKAITTK